MAQCIFLPIPITIQVLPLLEYHSGLFMKSCTSVSIRSAIPSSRTTELSGLGLRGLPNCRHSEPYAVYMMVFPSFCFTAKSRAVIHTHIRKFSRDVHKTFPCYGRGTPTKANKQKRVQNAWIYRYNITNATFHKSCTVNFRVNLRVQLNLGNQRQCNTNPRLKYQGKDPYSCQRKWVWHFRREHPYGGLKFAVILSVLFVSMFPYTWKDCCVSVQEDFSLALF